jgi:two-component system, chemotaxis family, CheB/CheR fusion protein
MQRKVPIVGVGASAGGLAAFTELLHHLDTSTGLALVFVQHLDATYPSTLAETLQRATAMNVKTARQDMQVEPNHVYVIPPDTCLGVHDGRLTLEPRPHAAPQSRHGLHLPIDFFFRSLAAENGQLSIGVVLSGSASDGTEGLRAIKGAGGITLAQEPSSAKFDSMPRSAVSAGIVDASLTIPAIAHELARLSHHPYLLGSDAPEGDQSSSWDSIFALVRAATGIDFSEYKRPTLERRLARRMALLKADSLDAYLTILHTMPSEISALARDSLIHVT